MPTITGTTISLKWPISQPAKPSPAAINSCHDHSLAVRTPCGTVLFVGVCGALTVVSLMRPPAPEHDSVCRPPGVKVLYALGAVAQLVARLVRNEKARGSNPLSSFPRTRLEPLANVNVGSGSGLVGICGPGQRVGVDLRVEQH